MKKFLISSISVLIVFFVASNVLAYVAASPNYKLEKDSINFGGTDSSASTIFKNNSTLGEIISGITNGTNYNASSGYRYMNPDQSTVTTTSGCKDPAANNYDSSFDVADNTQCTYDVTSCIDCGVFGCKDPNALNYNPNVTSVDNSTCTYASSGVRGCTNPKASNYDSLATINDGSCLFGGGPGPSDILGCTDPKAQNYNRLADKDDGSCNYSPFYSTSTEEILEPISGGWDFLFIQPQEKVKTFDSRMRVRIIGSKNLTILFNPNLATTSLKTIGVTLTDPEDRTKTFSFLMHRSSDRSAYEAIIGPLLRPGTYPIDFYIVSYYDQMVKHIRGNLIVSGPLDIWAVSKQVVPIAAATGLAVGFGSPLYNLFLLLFRFLAYFFGKRKEENPWGTVYDSETKRPLDPVYLTVNQAGSPGGEVATAITDIDGRFSFFLPAGTYTIKAGKTHYRFPSERLAGKSSDEIYDHLYFGGDLTTSGQEIININIPLDPIDFDWNEFAKTKKNFFEFYKRKALWLNRLYEVIFFLGFALSAYALVIFPSWWNIIVLALYFVVLALNHFLHNYHKPLRVERNGEPLPFSIVRIYLPDLHQQIKYAVADKLGRFYLLVRPGVYYYTVEEKQPDGSYLKVFQSDPINLPKGVLTKDIILSS